MNKKIICIGKQDERKFKNLVTRLSGDYMINRLKKNEKYYSEILIVFNKQEQFDLLHKKMESKYYDFYYPEEIGD